MSTMFAAATSFFARTNISQNYNYGSSGAAAGSRSSTPGPSSSPSVSTPGIAAVPTTVGLWKVTPATHKVTAKRVSVWSFDKRTQELERLSAPAKERVLEVLKAEVRTLYYLLNAFVNPTLSSGWRSGPTATSLGAR
jgi:SCY1-like protein 2